MSASILKCKKLVHKLLLMGKLIIKCYLIDPILQFYSLILPHPTLHTPKTHSSSRLTTTLRLRAPHFLIICTHLFDPRHLQSQTSLIYCTSKTIAIDPTSTSHTHIVYPINLHTSSIPQCENVI